MTLERSDSTNIPSLEGIELRDSPELISPRGQVLTNLDHCLRTADSSRLQLLSVQVLITDMAQWPAFDAAFADWISAHRPSRRRVSARTPLRSRARGSCHRGGRASRFPDDHRLVVRANASTRRLWRWPPTCRR